LSLQASVNQVREQFGDIDIYLFDQLQRGRIVPGMRIFDAGFGSGRNLIYFFRTGYEVFGADCESASVTGVKELASRLAPNLPKDNFRVELLENLSFASSFADVVISNAVLHFARDDRHFRQMLNGSWRVLKRGGIFFCRLASSIGLELQIKSVEGRRCLLPDGSERYLVNEEFLARAADELGAEMIDPLKTTVVQNERSMTTWVLRKR
jgi:tellurite methyltransferase